LVAEDEDFALRSEKRELVLCWVCERRELESGYLGAGRGCKLLESYPWEKEIFERRVGIFAWVMVCIGL
jgi:hypothetical protein